MKKLILILIVSILFILFWAGAIIGMFSSCSKGVIEGGNVEIIAVIVERLENPGGLIQCNVYDDIGVSYTGGEQKNLPPVIWQSNYIVPNFKNQYSISIVHTENGLSRDIVYFNVTFSQLTGNPKEYIYQDSKSKIILKLKWL